MSKDPRILISHITECIALIERYARRKTARQFLNSVALQDSVIRRLEIIGEATKNLTEILKADYPEVPWRKMANLRDVLIHEYFGIDLEIIWKIVRKDIPKLKKQILEIQNKLAGKVIDFTKIKKGGVKIDEILRRL